MKSGIYKIISLINNKVYIGSSSNIENRIIYHLQDFKRENHHNQHLQNTYNKYGKENLQFEVIELCDLKDCYIKEIYWSNFFDSFNPEKGYNIGVISANGIKSGSLSNETKEKMYKTRKENAEKKGYYHSEETKRKIGIKSKGRKHTPQTIKKIKDKLKYKKLSKEVSKKIVDSRKQNSNIWHSEETKSKISKSNKGVKKTKTEKFIQRVKSQQKEVLQIDADGKIIKIWESALQASTFYKIATGCIPNTCIHNSKEMKKYRKIKGFIWKYKKDWM